MHGLFFAFRYRKGRLAPNRWWLALLQRETLGLKQVSQIFFFLGFLTVDDEVVILLGVLYKIVFGGSFFEEKCCTYNM